MRPRGTYGAIAAALTRAAASPGTVRDLAYRAQVGLSAARYTASRLVSLGELSVVQASRPALLVSRSACEVQTLSHDESAALDAELRKFWNQTGPSDDSAD